MRERFAAAAAAGLRCAGRFWRLSVAALALGGTALVFGAPADLARGLAWLQSQVQADGSLLGSSTAAPQQARCETAATLLKLAGSSAPINSLIAALQPQGADATESVACWKHLRQQLGQNILNADIELRRVAQQGYGAYEGFGVANAMDTGWALAAQLQNLPAADKSNLLAWLQASQRADGSFATGSRADLLATAVVLRGLKDEASRNSTAGAVATKAASWLLAQRQVQDHWLDDPAITAVVFEAAHPYTAVDPTIASGVEAYLLAKQQPDGSWQGDTYVTAVALRALALTSVVPIDPILAAAATVRGVVTLVSTGEPLAGVTIKAQPASGTAKTAITDALGKYLLQGVTPGNIALSASLAGHAMLTAQVNLDAGMTAIFSPGMYPAGSTAPTEARIKGQTLNFGNNMPLAGVAVEVTGATQASVQTGAAGTFDLAASAGTHTVSYSLAGYITQYQQVVLSGGALADVGTIVLKPTRSSSSLRGLVTDLQGQAVAGATVAIQGGPLTTSSAAGAYSFGEIAGLQFAIQVSASGYATRSFSLSVSQPGDLVQDLSLPTLTAAYLSLSDLTLSSPSVGLRKDVTGTATVTNPSADEASAVASAVVVDPDGKRIATLVATDSTGNALPVVTLAAGGSTQVRFKWNSGSFGPGNYQFNTRLQVPETASRETPDGVIVAALQQPLAISPDASFFGSVTANPPVLRAGTNTPVKLLALIRNDGNVVLPAQDYRLAVVDTKTGQATHTQTISGDELPIAQLRTLSFADWTPAGGGNFRVELTAPSTPGSLVTTTLYVGDSGTATFTVDKSFVPAGTQTVKGSVKVTGQSVANGTINDPLVPLVKQAITTAVAKADTVAYDHYVNPSASLGQCYMCHVQSQAVAGGERSLRYTAPVNALRRSVLMSAITQNLINETATSMTSQGPLTEAAPVGYRDGPTIHRITNTTLGLWAASQWHDPAAVNYSKVRMANYLMKVQSGDGSWSVDHAAVWWQTKAPLAALNAGSLSALRDTLQAQPVPLGKKITPFAAPGLPSGDKRMTVGADGTIYVTLFGGQLWAVSPAGTATMLVNTVAVRSAWPLADGRLLIGSSSGVYIRETNGALNRLWNNNIFDAQPMANGNYLVTLWGGNSLYILTPSGTVSTLASNSRLGGTMGATIMPDGSIIAYGQSQIGLLRFSATGQLLDLPIPVVPPGGLMNSIPYKDGFLLATQVGLFYYNKDWVAERWTHERVFGQVVLPDGRLLINRSGALYVVEDDPVNVQANFIKIDSSMNKVANWLKAGSGIDGNNNIDVAFRLMGLGHAKKYFGGTARANEFDSLIQSLGATLRSRQRANDGGWVWRHNTHTVSDSMVTAMVGIALDNLNPSPDSPEVRRAVQFLLGAQRADGTWSSQNGVASTALLPTTWVEIWLPIMLERLGGIDTDLSVTFPANVTMSNPDRTPTSSVTASDGSTQHLWKLVGVTESSQQVNFNLMLQNMEVDEIRPVAQEAKLIFKNSFVEGSITAAIEVPRVAVGTTLVPTVRTDKPVYTEVHQAVFTATASNAGTSARDAVVRFSVLDSSGQVVDVLPLGPTISVPGGGTASTSGLWPIAGILSGNYQVQAELISPAGLIYGTATTSFAVTASQEPAAGARIGADRLSYTAAQAVQLTSRVANNTANTPLQWVQARTEVTSGGQSVLSRSEAIEQLAPLGTRQYGYSLPASGLPTGSYAASLQLLDATGSVLAQSTTSFTVLGVEQTGVGITGQLQANPQAVFVGQNAQLALQVTNTAAGSLSGVPLTVRLVEPVDGTVVANFTATVADWAAGQTHGFSFDWSAVGSHGQILVAAASAEVAGKTVPLAQANIKVLGILFTGAISADPAEVEAGSNVALNYSVNNPTVVTGRMIGKLDVQTQAGQGLANWPLELTIGGQSSFAGNQLYSTGEQLQTLTAVLSQQLGTSSVVLATTSFTVIDRPVPLGVNAVLKPQARILVLVSCPPGLGKAEDEACVAQRSQAIESYLSGLGLTAKTVSTREAFLAEMRCGSYNTYWISGGAMKLDEQTIGELREAIWRGEALWMDGVHDSRNQLLHDTAGVKELGKLPTSNLAASLAEGGLYGLQALATLGQPGKFELTTGAAQGLFTEVPGQQAPIPAVVANDYGQGKSLLFAFDLAAMVTADVVQANAQLAGFIGLSASHAASGTPTLTLGDVTRLSASIHNQGTRTVSFKAEATLPVGLSSMATVPQAQLSTNSDGSVQATWNFTLTGGATQELGWLVRAAQTGSYSVPLSIYSLPAAGSSLPPKLRATGTFTLEVKPAQDLLSHALVQVDALRPSASPDKTARSKVLNAVSRALALHNQGSYEQAMAQWLAAADALIGITSADTGAARAAVSLAIEASTDALCIQRCGTAACQ